jgi:hypothetical protein
VKFSENVTTRLKQVTKGLHSPEVTKEVHHAATIIAAAVRRRARRGDTGTLQAGIYVTSQYRDDRPTIQRRGRKVIQGPKYPPAPGQALVVSGAFYSQWVERGRKARGAMHGPGFAEGPRRGRRAVGRQRARPFFNAGVREAKPLAESFLRRRLSRLIETSFEK